MTEVELLAKFDPVMENHVSRVKDGDTHTHYLGKGTQNEFIQIVSENILDAKVSQIKKSKYFSIIHKKTAYLTSITWSRCPLF